MNKTTVFCAAALAFAALPAAPARAADKVTIGFISTL